MPKEKAVPKIIEEFIEFELSTNQPWRTEKTEKFWIKQFTPDGMTVWIHKSDLQMQNAIKSCKIFFPQTILQKYCTKYARIRPDFSNPNKLALNLSYEARNDGEFGAMLIDANLVPARLLPYARLIDLAQKLTTGYIVSGHISTGNLRKCEERLHNNFRKGLFNPETLQSMRDLLKELRISGLATLNQARGIYAMYLENFLLIHEQLVQAKKQRKALQLQKRMPNKPQKKTKNKGPKKNLEK